MSSTLSAMMVAVVLAYVWICIEKSEVGVNSQMQFAMQC
jgi:hypothetical protein